MGGKGGITVGKKKGGLTIISMYNVGRGGGGAHREDCATQSRRVVILQHPTTLMDSDCHGVCGGGLGEGGSRGNIMFFM